MLNAAMYERTSILLKSEGIEKLHALNVFLAGVGGVGGHCAEALVRAGVGKITIVDGDVVSSTNKNRQLIALDTNIGKSKVSEMAQRIQQISSHCVVTAIDAFLLPEDMYDILTRQRYNYVVDCIDSLECKISLMEAAAKLGINTFSSGGAGGRLDPSKVKTGDLFETMGDPLTARCRHELKKRGVGPGKIQMVFSDEVPIPPLEPQRQESGGRDRAMNGTISYMPSLFGLFLSSLVIRHAMNPVAANKKMARHGKKLAKAAEEADRKVQEKLQRRQQVLKADGEETDQAARAQVARGDHDSAESPDTKVRRCEEE